MRLTLSALLGMTALITTGITHGDDSSEIVHLQPVDSQYTTFTLSPDSQIVGAELEHPVTEGETLFRIARHYNLGFRELVAANPDIDPWFPEAGRKLLIPGRFVLPKATREGIVVNLAQRRLFYFPANANQVLTWPVAIGQQGHDTPLGETQITRKRVDPTWVPPPSVREKFDDLPASMPPGPNNPLGSRALDLGWPAYVIHGSNLAMGVGASLSHGCVRMYNRDVEYLYELVETGTRVTVVEQPVRLARQGQQLYMQVSPEWDKVDSRGRISDDTPADRSLDMQALLELIGEGGEGAANLDWSVISRTLTDPRGGLVLLGEL